MHHLAGAIDAALSEELRVDGAGRHATHDAAVGKIERIVGERKKRVVVFHLGDDHGRRARARAFHQPRLEGGVAVRVGALGRQHLVAFRHQPHFRVGHRLRRAERAHEHAQAAVGGDRGDAEVGDDEPLRRARGRVGIARAVGDAGNQRIDAGREIRHRLVHRERGDDLPVQLLLHVHLALVDAEGLLLRQAVELIALDVLAELAVDRRGKQPTVADLQDVDGDAPGVDGDERQALLAGARQHVGAAGEAHARLAVAHVGDDVRLAAQRLAARRRHAGAQRQLIALAVLEALDAELLIGAAHRRLLHAGDRHEWRKVGALGKRLGELQAETRRRHVGVHRVVEQAEAVLLAHFVVIGLQLRRGMPLQRELQRIERRAPDLPLGVDAADERKRVAFVVPRRRAPVGDERRRRRAVHELVLLARVRGRHRQEGAPEPQPRGRLIGLRRELAEALRRGLGILGRDRRIHLAPQIGDRFRPRRRVAPDLGFQPSRALKQVAPPVGLLRSIHRGRQEKKKERKQGFHGQAHGFVSGERRLKQRLVLAGRMAWSPALRQSGAESFLRLCQWEGEIASGW